MQFHVRKDMLTTKKIEKYLEVTDECKKLFDQSKDPIVVILQQNQGGFVDLEDHLQNSLAPYRIIESEVAMRIDKSSERVIRFRVGSGLIDPETLEPRVPDVNGTYEGPLGPWYDSPETDLFGDVKFVRTQKSLFKKHYEMKYNMTNVRNPNEIIIFTDQFCFSACNAFAKQFREKNSGILVAYSGLVQSDLRDVGQSPTVVIQDSLIHGNNETVLLEHGMTLSISFAPNYPLNRTHKTVPDEFIVHQPNEYALLEFYEETEESLISFLNEAQIVYEKYKEFCVDGMVLYEKSCIGNKNSVGGYKCKNGKYDRSKCVLVGCKNGIELNQTTGFCGDDKNEDFINGAVTTLVSLFVLVFLNKTKEMKMQIIKYNPALFTVSFTRFSIATT
ncbi:hypothetical protein EIN_068170 [Entamoeba invadens IP1]|uniref:Uncharacterized protein n=1 Tax=Entamoeba invadens IP1 TaxID=370355 RepID=A0A0A1TW82_ENTIV|nr:hypothetical protein EIN_068170 [Entamoeba invadens IP1]ELP83543.1 hypothetical protein EIN_068170 [Entamoeba invadens IP1]|eukprot:XP_004182889.1 hypothetical protein EIN_068170 [Entamoeba invadens IP1]